MYMVYFIGHGFIHTQVSLLERFPKFGLIGDWTQATARGQSVELDPFSFPSQ